MPTIQPLSYIATQSRLLRILIQYLYPTCYTSLPTPYRFLPNLLNKPRECGLSFKLGINCNRTGEQTCCQTGQDFNPGPLAYHASTLTTWLPSHMVDASLILHPLNVPGLLQIYLCEIIVKNKKTSLVFNRELK